MKKWVRPTVLVVVFLITLIVAARFLNKTNTDLTSKLAEATLPVVSFTYDDVTINELHGYTEEMDLTAVRDTVTPLKEDRVLHLSIATYGTGINGISYEIRTLDGSRLLADGEITEYSIEANHIDYDETVENILEVNEEYTYILTISTDAGDAHYYTRITQPVDRNVPESVDFAEEFHDYTLNGNGASFIPTYMDPATGDATTLNYVDLTCTLKQIIWADFEGDVLTDVVANITEINDTYVDLSLDYVMGYVNEDGETEYYNIDEFYRLRNTDTRMYVLAFERTMEQIFRGENQVLSDAGNLQLGIRNTDVQYQADDSGNVIAFVQQGELWCYDSEENNIAQIFSFRDVEGIDARENWDDHDIKIISVDEAGSVTFVVYGYMNRGDHEGKVGVAVYRYDGLSHTVEEEVFIPSDKSYQVLKAELGQLLYVNETDQLYLILDENLYEISLSNLSYNITMSGMSEDCYCVSESGRYFAYIDPSKPDSAKEITVLDLKDGSSYSISAKTGEAIRPLAFIDEDLIYGTADTADLVTDAAGNTFFAMKSLTIMETGETGLTEVKDYTPTSGYVGSVSVEDYIISVNLYRLNEEGRYVSYTTDSIMNKDADKDENVLITTTTTDIKETQVQLELKNTSKTSCKMITADTLVSEFDTNLTIDRQQADTRYYVCEGGHVLLATENISDAIDCAYDSFGVVIDQSMNTVWSRAKSSSVSAMGGFSVYETDLTRDSMTQCISALLGREEQAISVGELLDTGVTPLAVLSSTLTEDQILDLSGCTLAEVLYYVNLGNPVLAMTGSNSAVLITGYTSKLIYYYDPNAGSSQIMDIDTASDLFDAAGNLFITYIK